MLIDYANHLKDPARPTSLWDQARALTDAEMEGLMHEYSDAWINGPDLQEWLICQFKLDVQRSRLLLSVWPGSYIIKQANQLEGSHSASCKRERPISVQLLATRLAAMAGISNCWVYHLAPSLQSPLEQYFLGLPYIDIKSIPAIQTSPLFLSSASDA